MNLFEINNLSKRYDKAKTTALDRITLSIPSGSIFGLIGPNGAGKTTLISILIGLLKRSGGEIYFESNPVANDFYQIREATGFVPQELALYPMLSVSENLNFYVAAFGVAKQEQRRRVEFAIEATKLGEHLKKEAQQLSGGLKRRLNLAVGLLNAPRILFLDEPTVGIDPQSRLFILETITNLNKSEGMTVIYTSHYMDEVEQICDHIAIIDHGKILLQGSLQALLKIGTGQRMQFQLQTPLDSHVRQLLNQRYNFKQLDLASYEIEGETLDEMIGTVPSLLKEHGLQLSGIRYGYQTLEDLYLHHTTTELRE